MDLIAQKNVLEVQQIHATNMEPAAVGIQEMENALVSPATLVEARMPVKTAVNAVATAAATSRTSLPALVSRATLVTSAIQSASACKTKEHVTKVAKEVAIALVPRVTGVTRATNVANAMDKERVRATKNMAHVNVIFCTKPVVPTAFFQSQAFSLVLLLSLLSLSFQE